MRIRHKLRLAGGGHAMFEEKIKELIEEKSVHKLERSSRDNAKEIEKRLNVVLPESYKWLVNEYGSVSFFGFEIDGIGLNDVLISVQNTENWRSYGLPQGYVVIYEPGAEWIHCLDTNRLENGECPVVAWYQGQDEGEEEAPNLYSFIVGQIKE